MKSVLAWRVALLASVVAASLGAQGFRLDVGLFLAQPRLAARSSEVFAGLGRFRPGLGADFGIGYDTERYGLMLMAGAAGIELGAPITRDGIGMGREPGIFNATAFLGSWRSSHRIGSWRPVLSAGYLSLGINNISLRADSLPDYARGLAASPPDSVRRLVGVAGRGGRLGASLERPISASDFSGRMLLAIEFTADMVRFDEVSYDGGRAAIPNPGTSVTPRLAVSFRWSPRAPNPPQAAAESPRLPQK